MGVLTAIVVTAAAGSVWLFLTMRTEADSPDSAAMFLKISAMEQVIRQKCLHDFSEEEQTNSMLQGMVSALEDPYAAYYTREEYESIRRSNKGYKQGIGVTIRQEEDGRSSGGADNISRRGRGGLSHRRNAAGRERSRTETVGRTRSAQ